jgi:hypothetical protein
MAQAYWHQQTADQPLYPDLLWSRPEHSNAAGKLLIVGGNAHAFSAPANAYSQAVKAGVGTVRIILPDATKKIIGPILGDGEYVPSTPSGSFGKRALAELLDMANWADGVLLAGDVGRNSETAILLESFLQKCPCPVTVTKDAIDYFYAAPQTVLNRPNTTIVVSLAQLQKLVMAAKFPRPITFGMDLLTLVDTLHELTIAMQCNIITKHLDTIFVASDGEVSTTKLPKDIEVWRVSTAANAAVWWLQNPNKIFESLTTAIAT